MVCRVECFIILPFLLLMTELEVGKLGYKHIAFGIVAKQRIKIGISGQRHRSGNPSFCFRFLATGAVLFLSLLFCFFVLVEISSPLFWISLVELLSDSIGRWKFATWPRTICLNMTLIPA